MLDNINRINRSEKNAAGVYIIVCCNKMYVGQTNNFGKDAKKHYKLLMQNKHPYKRMQADWNAYGYEQFGIQLLVKENNPEERTKTQQFYIKLGNRKNSYNFAAKPFTAK